jgi:uncharacterized membrane protein
MIRTVFGAYRPDALRRARTLRQWGLRLLVGGVLVLVLTYFGNGAPLLLGLPVLELACVAAGVGAGLTAVALRLETTATTSAAAAGEAPDVSRDRH